MSPLELVRCLGSCGLVQQRYSPEPTQLFGETYGYRSGLNQSMVEHLHYHMNQILQRDLLEDGDLLVDIGSNDGTFLKGFLGKSAKRPKFLDLLGVDPLIDKFRKYYPAGVDVVNDFFSSEILGGRKAKVITSFAMFYDLEDPLGFMRDIYNSLEKDGIWVFEQSYLPAMMCAGSFDTVCHEHLEFYSLRQIDWMARQTGLVLLDVQFSGTNGGSFVVTASKGTRNSEKVNALLAKEPQYGETAWSAFRGGVERAKRASRKFLETAKEKGERVLGLGASTKGNVLLQHFGIGPELLQCIGDVNEDKVRSFTPGTGIPIIEEELVLMARPTHLFVLPWHFKEFFLRCERLKGHSLVFPLPSFMVYHHG